MANGGGKAGLLPFASLGEQIFMIFRDFSLKFRGFFGFNHD